MDPLWVGKALLLSLIGVILGMILRVIMGILPTDTRKVLQLYLLVVGIWAAIGFGSVFPLFSYLSINDGYSAEIAGIQKRFSRKHACTTTLFLLAGAHSHYLGAMNVWL